MYAYIKSPYNSKQFLYIEKPVEEKFCYTKEEVISSLKYLDSLNCYILCYFSFEAYQVFEDNLPSFKSKFPLFYYAIFTKVESVEAKTPLQEKLNLDFKFNIDKCDYLANFNKILSEIKQGNLYQLNYSFDATCTTNINPEELFFAIENAHPTNYATFIKHDEYAILSHSPELFISKRDNMLTSLPMKGTIKRKHNLLEDKKQQEILQNDSKSRAENIMIVDLMRHDFSKICKAHSIKCSNLFEVKEYRTLHQMTSKVQGVLTTNSIYEIMQALFPAGSITGTPKIQAIKNIHKFEQKARNIYTGAIGLIEPNGNFTFNVAIRTLLYQDNKLNINIGSGIVADSNKEAEWQECLLKSNFIKTKSPNFIFRTLFCKKNTFRFLRQNLHKLKAYALFFNFPFDLKKILQILKQGATENPSRIRLEIHKNEIKLSCFDFVPWKKECKLKISAIRINKDDVFHFYKTNLRNIYDIEFLKAKNAGFDEVIFLNEDDEICQGAISNIFFEDKQGKWHTPVYTSGLLQGVWRDYMIQKLSATTRVISLKELASFKRILIGNNVRMHSDAYFAN